MEYKQDIYVDKLPEWNLPCPICKSKYPAPAVSHKRDGSGAWCKNCGQNWKIGKRQGFDPKGWHPKPTTPTTPSAGAEAITETFARHSKLLKNLDERLKRIEGMVQNDKVVFYPTDEEIKGGIKVEEIPF